MLLRLQVQGFKNLRDIDVRFGPLTCFVGRNGVGKSNIFDAIQFLRLLSEREIQQAAEAVRSPTLGVLGPLDLFPDIDRTTTMRFVADLLVPRTVIDDFGEEAEPSTNLLRYAISFRYAHEPRPRLELLEEELIPLRKGDARKVLGFPHTPRFRESAVKGSARKGLFISTSEKDDGRKEIMLHQDGGSRGRPVNPGNSPRTVLGGTNTKDYPTVLAARREMSSWHSLQLEPSSLRSPDQLGSIEHVSEHGAHIASTLLRLARERDGSRVYADAANRLSELVPETRELRVDEDLARQQLTVQVKLAGSEEWYGPRAISDGTLRFLALVIMQMDYGGGRVLCMEEPENGIHPFGVSAMVRLLRDFAVDPELELAEDNPPRQVVLNSHSADVLRQLSRAEVLFVERIDSRSGAAAAVSPVEGSWREQDLTVTLDRLQELMGGAPEDEECWPQLVLPYESRSRR